MKELSITLGKSISLAEYPNCDMLETLEYKGLIVCVTPGGDTWKLVEGMISQDEGMRCRIFCNPYETGPCTISSIYKYCKFCANFKNKMRVY